jgi:hypothetical protein
MYHIWGRGGVYSWFWWENLRGNTPLEIPRHRGKDNIKMDLWEVDVGLWTGSI